MRNKIASSSRVKGIMADFVMAGYTFVNWTEDGPYDSPILEMTSANGDTILIAVDTDSIHVTPWGPGTVWDSREYADAEAFLA